jgi:hypothetical protein
MADSTPAYTTNTGNLKKFLEEVPKVGVPPKITQEYLTKLNYKSSNDRRILTVLRFIGFIQSDGTPTEFYKQFRNTEMSRTVMAKRLRASYSDLFNTYPNAYEKDDEALVNFMRSSSNAQQETLMYAVRTFKILCSFADFNSVNSLNTEGEPLTVSLTPDDPIKRINQPGDPQFVLNVNVQITLPETKDHEVYEKIFESLRKHLLNKQPEDTL